MHRLVTQMRENLLVVSWRTTDRWPLDRLGGAELSWEMQTVRGAR